MQTQTLVELYFDGSQENFNQFKKAVNNNITFSDEGSMYIAIVVSTESFGEARDEVNELITPIKITEYGLEVIDSNCEYITKD